MPQSSSAYSLIRVPGGVQTVYSSTYKERMHRGLGPSAEAEHIDISQARIRDRMQDCASKFVVWDIGLGAAANALTLLRVTRDLSCPLRLVSFDDTLDPLSFALLHREKFEYLRDYESVTKTAIEQRQVEFMDLEHTVRWELHIADFPTLLASNEADSFAKPDAILFDPFSPAKNPVMWTLPLFERIFQLLDPLRGCILTTYSRSTMVRVGLLLAGFSVGRGRPSGMKEETTVAASALDLLDEPLDPAWLQRGLNSASAEPLKTSAYRQSPLSAQTWERLQQCPQFA